MEHPPPPILSTPRTLFFDFVQLAERKRKQNTDHCDDGNIRNKC